MTTWLDSARFAEFARKRREGLRQMERKERFLNLRFIAVY